MMLEDQVTSLELSKKLLTLGVKQNSLFYWVNYPVNGYIVIYKDDVLSSYDYEKIGKVIEHDYGILSAFTASELMEILPIKLKHLLSTLKSDLGYECRYDFNVPWKLDKKLCDCLAKMLIYLIENKLMAL